VLAGNSRPVVVWAAEVRQAVKTLNIPKY